MLRFFGTGMVATTTGVIPGGDRQPTLVIWWFFRNTLEDQQTRSGGIPGLVNQQKAIENGHRNSEFSHKKW